MSFRNRLKKQEKQFTRILFYGETGAGKTQLQVGLYESPLFIDMDNSITGKFNKMEHVTKINDITNMTDLLQILKEIIDEKEIEFDALVLDIDHIVTAITRNLMGKKENNWKSMEALSYDGCWKIAREKLEGFLKYIEAIGQKMHIALTAHASDRYKIDIKNENKMLKVCPNLYNSTQVKLNDIVMAWVENIFYLHTVSDGDFEIRGFKKKYKAFKRNGNTIRLIEAGENPYYEAKNRCGLDSTIEFNEEFDYDKFRKTVFGDYGKFESNIETVQDSDIQNESDESNESECLGLTDEEKQEILNNEIKEK